MEVVRPVYASDPMTPSIPALLFALLSFIVTFAVARVLGRKWRKRKAEKAELAAAKGQSRQVRRAKQRRKSGN
jgi:flagellar biosynthesis/type III secretory pathway M-ring protein FliF/YscJ